MWKEPDLLFLPPSVFYTLFGVDFRNNTNTHKRLLFNPVCTPLYAILVDQGRGGLGGSM